MEDQPNAATKEFLVSLDADGLLARAQGLDTVDLHTLVAAVPTLEVIQAGQSGFLHVRVATAFAESLVAAVGDRCVVDDYTYLELYGHGEDI